MLEHKLTEFIEKLNCVSAEMEKIKIQQQDIIELVKQTIKKK